MHPLLLAATALALVSDGLPTTAPSAVGMSSSRLEAIDRVVNRGIKAGGYPGAAVVVGRKGYAVWEKGFGHLTWSASSPSVVADRTIYDLASLTKVVATTSAAMVLFDEGKLDLDTPVARYLPEFSGGAKDRITIRMLLEHRSGLPAGRELWRIAHTPDEARAAVLATPLEYEPDHGTIYSDLGADVLGFVIESISGQRLDQFVTARVFQPLGMNDTYFRPSMALHDRIAPTEVAPPRGYPLQGEVHDENAYALGGVAGHAGLFSTAADLSIFAQMMLNHGVYNGTRVFSERAVDTFIRRGSSGSTRALGWDTCDGKYGCGRLLGSTAYGHTGFTGTSLWIDPERDVFVVLLTNRVHEARAKRPSKVISDVRADLADAATLAVIDAPGGVLRMPASFRADKAKGWNTPERSARRSHSKSHASKSHASKSKKSKASASKSKKSSAKSSAKKSTARKSVAKKSSSTKKKKRR